MTPREILIAARAKIEDRANWTQLATARDAVGATVHSRSPQACQWCAIGALNAVASRDTAIFDARDILGSVTPQVRNGEFLMISDVNDLAGHMAVMEMFDLAIAKAAA